MLTRRQISSLEKNVNYQVIRLTNEYVELMSHNTQQCWLIKKEPASLGLRYPYTLYHKHRLGDYYHRHWYAYTFEKCIQCIDSHENYVMNLV